MQSKKMNIQILSIVCGIKYYLLCVEFTLLDHFSHLKAGHLSWLFIFNSVYYYQKERKQLLGEYLFEGIWLTFCSLFREGTKALTCCLIKLDTGAPLCVCVWDDRRHEK